MNQKIFILTSAAAYEQARALGQYAIPDPTEGFIHASPADQLNRVANKYYTGVEDLLLLIVDPQRVHAEIKWEPATGGLYPHIYGDLNLDAVTKIVPIQKAADGTIVIQPETLE